MDDRYLTIEKPFTQGTKVKGSRFIARTALASTVEQARAQLEAIRKTEHAATHNCYAYVIGFPNEKAEFKYSDDGEPGGTAGRPIYDVVNGSGVTNILLVVTRYFGGTKLGTGGLVKAYSEAAKLAMEKSGTIENFVTDHLKVEIDFPIYDSLMKAAHRLGAVETKSEFTDRVSLELKIRRSLSERLLEEIVQLSKGKAKIEKV